MSHQIGRKFAPNALSSIGRLSFSAHLAVYPILIMAYSLRKKHSAKKQAIKKEKNKIVYEVAPQDPDLFNAFTAIPYHANKELKYSLMGIEMKGYLNKNSLHPQTYEFRSFLDSFDFQGENDHYFDWTVVPERKLYNPYTQEYKVAKYYPN